MTLKDARKALGWTQQKLEAESGIKQQVISALETGDVQRVSLDAARDIVSTLQRAGLKGLTLDDLFPRAEKSA